MADFLASFRDRQRRHKRALAASDRLGRDDAAWAELFRRSDWAPPAAGHLGRCGHCSTRIDAALHQCPSCGAEWKPNRRRSDLYRQVAAYGAATAFSVVLGHAVAAWLRAHFAAIEARGETVNPEMVDTLASFLWLFCGVMAMIGLTYAIERLAPTGHWRRKR